MALIIEEGFAEKFSFIKRFVGNMDNITNGNMAKIAAAELRFMGITDSDLKIITHVLDLDFRYERGLDAYAFWYDPL